MQLKREVDVVIVSDVHLGTYGCHAKELLQYLRSLHARVLILNGDIVDGWAFSKNYWPTKHHEILLEVMQKISQGTKVYYLTGNHDEVLRQFSEFSLSNFHLADKLVLELDGKKAWIFHGDVFDFSVHTSKWLAKFAGKSYDYLIILNRLVNWVLTRLGREKVSISKKIKNSVKKAVKFIGDFEEEAARHAIEQGYDFVICGHIHQPQMRTISNDKGSVLYLNSGDWIENLTSLEYHRGKWSIYRFNQKEEPMSPRVLNKKGMVDMASLKGDMLLSIKTY